MSPSQLHGMLPEMAEKIRENSQSLTQLPLVRWVTPPRFATSCRSTTFDWLKRRYSRDVTHERTPLPGSKSPHRRVQLRSADGFSRQPPTFHTQVQ